MNIYIYINPDAAVYLYGVLNTEIDSGDNIKIMYSTVQNSSMSLMVSMTMDKFVYLQDLDILETVDLIQN
tara:strand:- start:526 stop:735 length:210 start_codon:yes stop_codon:yes gene_type:complete